MIIAIDPDVDKCGIAILRKPYHKADMELKNLPLWDTIDYAKKASLVVIEAGWLNGKGMPFKDGKKRSVDVGRNHEIGKQIWKACLEFDIGCLLYRPSTKKWTHDEFCLITGSSLKRSNEEQRDAARALVESSAIALMRSSV